MKLICVNARNILINNVNYVGQNLIEGNEYDTRAKICLNEHGEDCYYIDGIGLRLKIRFAELLDGSKNVKEEAEEAMEKIKKEFDLI